jgi:hypothetical protein
MAEHSAAYKALKDSGAFTPKAGLNNGGCKSDPVKLCAWKLRRKAGHKDLQAPAARLIKRRNDRLIRREIKDFKFSRSSQRVRDGLRWLFGTSGLDEDIAHDGRVPEEEKLEYFADQFDLDKRGIKLKHILGKGENGCVVSGSYKGKPAAIKFAYNSTRSMHCRETDIEVHNYKVMSKALPAIVPKLHTAFKLKGGIAPDDFEWVEKGGQPYLDIIVMEKIDYEFDDLYLKNKDDSKFVRQAAKQLKEIVMALRAKNIVHGDLHLRNMGYKLVRGVPKLFLIDFANVRPMAPDETYEDSDNVWSGVGDANHALLKKMLEAIDFPKAPAGFVSPGDEGYYRYWTKTRKVAHIPLG